MRISLAASERQERRIDAIVSYGMLILATAFALFPIL